MVSKFHSKEKIKELVRQAYHHGTLTSMEDARDIFDAALERIGETSRFCDVFSFYMALGTLWEAGKAQGIRDERRRRRDGKKKQRR